MSKNFNFNRGQNQAYNLQEKFIPRSKMLRPSLITKQNLKNFTTDKLDRKLKQVYESKMQAISNKGNLGSNQIVEFEKNGDRKMVMIQEVQEDPFNPPQFKQKRIPQGPRSPPEPLLRSPPKKLTNEDIKQWKIPPCVSNYKKGKGFLVPLEKRLQMEKQSKKDQKFNNKFNDYSTALYLAEKNAKKQLQEKKKLQEIYELEKIKNQQKEYDELYEKLKIEKEKLINEESDDEDRNLLKQMIKKKVEREVKIDNVLQKKNKELLQLDRDVAEKIALGEELDHQQNIQYDQRLFKEEGLDQGYKGSDKFKIFDEPFLKEKIKTNIYSGVQQFSEFNQEDDDQVFLRKKEIYNKQDKNQIIRNKPLEFEKQKKINQVNNLMKFLYIFLFIYLSIQNFLDMDKERKQLKQNETKSETLIELNQLLDGMESEIASLKEDSVSRLKDMNYVANSSLVNIKVQIIQQL